MLLRHRLFEEVNLQLVAKQHGANSWMFLMKWVQVVASPRGKHVPGVEINNQGKQSLLYNTENLFHFTKKNFPM
ncbi:hypothetical protein [Bacillus sp. B-jedd]|uniref:hypothetical protein n=2 Tax=Bacillus sp. B-jedd TaxID=1476857 RepID=UPI0005156898|nr:hypothetical protein [Bacillus sp. B-jedd]CEG27880.1 hypothetical protein BN1002_02753 [Bacillus sp. B-jedd]